MVCVAGEIASGKTTFARGLAEAIPDSHVRSFGDVVRREAQYRAMSSERESLQAVGLQLIEAGWPSFVDKLLSDLPSDISTLVVDGIRHREAFNQTEVASNWRYRPVGLYRNT